MLCALACRANPRLSIGSIARHPAAWCWGGTARRSENLGLLFKQGKVRKTYWGIVEGNPEGDEGLIDLPLKRLDARRGWWMKADSSGLPSQTSWRVLGRTEN